MRGLIRFISKIQIAKDSSEVCRWLVLGAKTRPGSRTLPNSMDSSFAVIHSPSPTLSLTPASHRVRSKRRWFLHEKKNNESVSAYTIEFIGKHTSNVIFTTQIYIHQYVSLYFAYRYLWEFDTKYTKH